MAEYESEISSPVRASWTTGWTSTVTVPPGSSVKPLGSTLLEIASNWRFQVVADRRAADHPTAFPGVGPVDVGMHQFDGALEIARVERSVGGSQDGLTFDIAEPDW
jgi:hypothetical protein